MKRSLSFLFLLTFLLSACGAETPLPVVPTQARIPAREAAGAPIYTDPSQPIEARVEDLLKRMNLQEKIGQMTQAEYTSIDPGDITNYNIGALLTGQDSAPENNTVQYWYNLIGGFQKQALATRLKIPMIFGADAAHGHGIVLNVTIFPHNIGLGATHDPDLVEKIGRATAEEMLATGIPWNFFPVVAVPQDVRWGRIFEAYSENTEIVTSLGTAYIRGLQSLTATDAPAQGQSILVLATPKHFIGDGATIWGSSRQMIYEVQFMLDQGNMQVPEPTVRKLFLPPYQAALDEGIWCVMASFSSWKGTKMHAQEYLLTDVLKKELGFKGFIVSDFQGIDQVDDDYYTAVVTAINAGVDMNMNHDYMSFIEAMHQAVSNGDIPEDRVDDAVRRILRAKFALGLFEHPMPDKKYQNTVRSREHLDLARQAVRESLVLLKNEGNLLPLDKDTPVIFVAGEGANDIGMQSGGWTLGWQGKKGNDNEGTTIFSGLRAALNSGTQIEYSREGDFSEFKDPTGNPLIADVGVVVLAEEPYGEGVGERADISLQQDEIRLLNKVREQTRSTVVILISSRPRVISGQLPMAEAWVTAWLPGTEAGGVADVLFGDYPFTGKLPYTWPRSNEQLPINLNNSASRSGCDAPLFPFGYGLAFGENMPKIPQCP